MMMIRMEKKRLGEERIRELVGPDVCYFWQILRGNVKLRDCGKKMGW